MKLGIYGGSFDPVHVGHLLLAECCREELGLDEVWFVPAYQAPHKLGRQTTAIEHRYQMLLLATVGNAGFHVSSLEIDRQGTSYTVDTLEHIHATKPQAELYLLMGADTFQDLPNWRSPNRLCELAAPVVVHRRGQTPSGIAPILLAGNVQINARCVPMPLIELSSTELRERVASAQSIRYRTSAAVEQYIAEHGLYQRK
ncbi:MAG: nicotinate-nucleotide adenylyltransferase [Planctomycetota bacterium]|nr:nicotinate-nucleotide adenylyltransferase [Planctomycetota bacterium]MDA1179265.1 nicotinate-nucleotide adenylyltransferase [Planctomycetota bacterium]